MDNLTPQKLFDWLLSPPLDAPRSTVLVRWMAGGVFLSEGVLKFVYPNQGVGRFTKLGFPLPEMTAHFVAGLEIVGGMLLMAGLLTRLIAIPFVIEMIVAMLTTKIGLYLGTSPLPLPPSLPKLGIWAVLHETRSEYAQILCCMYLMFVGAGPWSLDAYLRRRREQPDETAAVRLADALRARERTTWSIAARERSAIASAPGEKTAGIR